MSLTKPIGSWDGKLPANYPKLNRYARTEVRRHYMKLQHWNCMWCKKSLFGEPDEKIQAAKINWELFPPEFLKYPHHLQHDHKTGLTEGTVHALCNAYMWQYHGR